MGTQQVRFGGFVLDLRAGLLSRDGAAIPLRPKTFAVLRHLTQHPGELISKLDLLDAVWGDVAVTEDMPRLSIGELRRALGDDCRRPSLIVTVPRRGYRFIAPVEPASPGAGDTAMSTGGDVSPSIVGREDAHDALDGWLRAALAGDCQVGLVVGEMGIGKTALVEAFLHRHGAPVGTAGRSGLRVAWGECLEQYGGAVPYLSLLEGLRRLARGRDAEATRAILRQRAPAWLLRAVGLLEPGDGAAGVAAPPEDSLHPLADVLAALSLHDPLILVLEDLQWSSHATVDLLNLLAHRREPARLLVLGTLRESESIVLGHPVVSVIRDLHRRGLCGVAHLPGLSKAEITSYVAQRLPGGAPPSLPQLLLDCSQGNPLFLTALLDDLIGLGVLRREEECWTLGIEETALQDYVPQRPRAAVERQLEHLSLEERRVLEAASVAGMTFATHVVATALGDEVEDVEERCDALENRHGLLRRMEPDGYGFCHSLHRQVVRKRIPTSRLGRLQDAIATQSPRG
jgi:DNA-binding winged helix-turn-helix (wHTH) protein